ncbi:MAG: L,D-transpeptidase [Syntrophobacteraceae bacterium]
MNVRIFYVLMAVLLFFSPVIRPGLGAADDAAGNSGSRKSIITWTQRVINEQELEAISQRDMDLSPSVSRRLLAKLNARDFDYIAQDIKDGKPLKVPNDFTAFKSWTPLEKYIPDVADLPKFILIVKDVPYIGWYERGKLVGDTYICVGKVNSTTTEGLYTVQEKDLNHVSRSYPNAYGEPAPMPWALRIYGTVWIHAGDIVSGHCSHGCVNLPMFSAMKLFDWATPGTPVLIVDSLGAVPSVLAANRSNCTLHALVCSAVGKVAAGS